METNEEVIIMKKEYKEPLIEVVKFDNEDVITTSSFGNSIPGYEDTEFPF